MKVTKELGERALLHIGNYPLYASTSNVTYEQAVRVAVALDGDWLAKNGAE